MDAPKPASRMCPRVTEPMLPRAPGGREWRIALYSHDTMGIGHMRRNTLIASAIAASPLPATMLLIAGAREAGTFPLPPGTDCLTLPSYHKEAGGQYGSRSLRTSVAELTSLRAHSIVAALESFEPDVFIVDKVPRGALRELEPALEYLQSQRRTRCLLGLRDVLDDPTIVRREWTDGAFCEAIYDYYDAVWIYGDPAVYDQLREYGYPAAVASRVTYTGYLARPRRTHFNEIDGAELIPQGADPRERLFLCLVGGGQDGPAVAEAFARVDFPMQTRGVILTGPFMPPQAEQQVRRLALSNPRLRVIRFVTDPDLLLSLADRVVAMGGYNTVCELLAYGKRSLIVPRVAPRREQLVRAQRLQQMGLLDVLHPDQLSPESLGRWLLQEGEPPRTAGRIDLGGVQILPRLLWALLQQPRASLANAHLERSPCHAIS